MRRPGKRCSRRGLLLVEAVLSATVIAVGLVFVSRGLSSQLHAVRTLEAYDTLVLLARSKMEEFEGKRFALEQDQAGDFDPPYDAYQWDMSTTPRREPADQNGNALTKTVTCNVHSRDGHGPRYHVRAIWPASWISDGWR